MTNTTTTQKIFDDICKEIHEFKAIHGPIILSAEVREQSDVLNRRFEEAAYAHKKATLAEQMSNFRVAPLTGRSWDDAIRSTEFDA